MKAHHTSLAILRVDPIHPLDWHWAVHQSGQYMILCENVLFSEEVKLPQLKGIHGMYKQLPNKTSHGTLFFILKDNNNWELFLALCLDIIQATMRPQLKDQHATIIGHRLLKWQDFLKKERSNNLTEFQIIGLLGELFFFEKPFSVIVWLEWCGVVMGWPIRACSGF